tara:strand:- start:410 stop:523 length:114 start_codon:yes stop_codon:yes gene_type:complete
MEVSEISEVSLSLSSRAYTCTLYTPGEISEISPPLFT